MTFLYCDTETFCEIPITHGSYAYSEKVEVMIWTYALNDEPVKLWDRTKDKQMPADLKKALDDPKIICVFHNGGGFDRIVIEADKTLGIRIPPERIHDTMAQAFSHGFPGSLDVLCDIMQVPVAKAKDKDGKKLINLFCKPKKDGTRATRLTHPLEWDRFESYAKLDIEAMRYIHKHMPLWNYTGKEFDLWCLDQRINERGAAIDIDLPNAAIRAVKRAQAKLAVRTDDLTLGDVASTTQRDELLRHILEAYGVELPDLQASTLEHRMEDPELPLEVKELLAIRLQASSSSTAKYSKFLKNISSDGRIRGTLQFSGAARTKRWAGRAVQLHNMPRPNLKPEVIDFGIECMKADCEDLFFDDVMELARNAVRGCIVATPKHKLVVSDLSNIEGRDAAWLAGEEWKLKAFRSYDARIGHDLYRLSYAKAFGIKPDAVDGGKKSGPQRQIGKVMELMLQFQGGVGAFITGAATYQIDLDDMAKRALPEIPRNIIEAAESWWEQCVKEKRTLGLKHEVFIACDSLKRLWRLNHPRIESMWGEVAEATRAAIETKNSLVKCRHLAFIRTGNWLRMILPSGYFLCYPSPQVKDDGTISFMGMDQYTRKWGRIKTFGGKLFENSCQAVARDVMAWNMQPIEDAGYKIILSVHDELITEAPDTDEYSDKKLSKLLAANPVWAKDIPLAAGGFSAYRYRKGD